MDYGMYSRLGIYGLAARTRIEPNNETAHFYLGLALYNQQNWFGAEQSFARAIEVDSKLGIARRLSGQAELHLAKAILYQGRRAEALERFREASYYLSGEIAHAEACVYAGELSLELGRLEQALTFFKEGLSSNRAEARLHFGMARLSETNVEMERPKNFNAPERSEVFRFLDGNGKSGKCRGRIFRVGDPEKYVVLISADEDREGISASFNVERALWCFRERYHAGRSNIESYLYNAHVVPTIVRIDGAESRQSIAEFQASDFEHFEQLTGYRLRWDC